MLFLWDSRPFWILTILKILHEYLEQKHFVWLVQILYKTVVQKYVGKEFVLGFSLTFPDYR